MLIILHSQGMPITRKNAKPKGDLLIKIEVVFPERLAQNQVEALRRIL